MLALSVPEIVGQVIMKRVTTAGGHLVEPRQTVGPTEPHSGAYFNSQYFDYGRSLAYPESKDSKVWQAWRRKLRRKLRDLFCLDNFGAVPTPDFVVQESEVCDGYRCDKLAYETMPDNWVSAYLLVPDEDGPRPAVICPHGHGMNEKEGVIGAADSPGVPYGRELALQGVVTLAPDNAFMGERHIDECSTSGCMVGWARLNHMGLDLTGLRVFDMMVGINVLNQLQEVDSTRIGCAGLSGGCWLTQVLAALDRRIKAVILSGFFTTFVQTGWHGHCVCHHPHGMGLVCDLPDLSALIAPRPQFIESGIDDEPYPHEPAFGMVQKAYELLDSPENLHLHRYPGGHMFRGEKSIPWLVSTLSA